MKYNKLRFDEITLNYDKKRIPLSAMERTKRQGEFRYFGAQGVIDYVDDYIFDGKYLLIAEDGENLKSKRQNIAQIVEGKFWVNNHAHIVQCNEKCILEYLAYLINSKDVSGYITGSAQPKLSQANLNAMEFDIPPIKEQQDILSILLPIEQKIRINNEINNNLFEQAKALFKNWFIDYEPFSTDNTVPENWRIGTVGEIILLHDSKRIPLSGTERDKMKKIYPYYGATSLMDYVDNYLFDGIYLLLGEDGTVVDDKGFPVLQYIDGKFWVNNHAHILTGKLGYSVEELYLLFSLTNIKSIVTGAVQQKVSQTNLKKVPAIIPPVEVLKQFDDIIKPIFAEIRNLRNENQRLSSIRDSILPKLMSGDIDVSEINL